MSHPGQENGSPHPEGYSPSGFAPFDFAPFGLAPFGFAPIGFALGLRQGLRQGRGIRGLKPEVGGGRLEVGSWNLEVSSQHSEPNGNCINGLTGRAGSGVGWRNLRGPADPEAPIPKFRDSGRDRPYGNVNLSTQS